MYEDKTLRCKECGNEFVFTAGEQEFYAEKGFMNKPKACKACRDAKKNGLIDQFFYGSMSAEYLMDQIYAM